MIIRVPSDYFFQNSDLIYTRHTKDKKEEKVKKYYKKLLTESADKDDVYSFKFADDEYVEEATK